MNNDVAKILARIRKCLALARSSEPHEAAAALRQAQKLMELHGISHDDARLSDVRENPTDCGRKNRTPPAWLTMIANSVAQCFGVTLYYQQRGYLFSAQIVFVGIGPAPEVAGYAFDVLRRQCERARRDYYRDLRGTRAGRVRRADAYAIGWVRAVHSKIEKFAKECPKVVEDYLVQSRINLVAFKPINRTTARNEKDAGHGFEDGLDVELQHGVRGGALEPLLISTK